MAALIALGAVLGALCGALALIPLAIQHTFWPTPRDSELGSPASWLPFTMTIGAIIGSIFGPTVSFTLLRRAPLWRVLVVPTSAAIMGIFASWALFRVRLLPDALTVFAPLWLPTACAIGASIWLASSVERGTLASDRARDAATQISVPPTR